MTIPKQFKDDLEKAIKILKDAGCTEIYLFGSLIEEKKNNSKSDIDIAVKGLPKSDFFSIYGELLTTLHHSVDLVGLDYEMPFSQLLNKRGKLERVA